MTETQHPATELPDTGDTSSTADQWPYREMVAIAGQDVMLQPTDKNIVYLNPSVAFQLLEDNFHQTNRLIYRVLQF